MAIDPITGSLAISAGSAALGSIFGGDTGLEGPSIFPQGSFLAKNLAQLLNERLATPPGETDSFRMLESALGESLSARSRGLRQRLSDSAVTGGFADSGAVIEGNQDIDRAELESFGQGIRDILLALEDRRTSGVLPFLGATANERLGEASAISGADQFGTSTGLAFGNQFGSLANMFQGTENQHTVNLIRSIMGG